MPNPAPQHVLKIDYPAAGGTHLVADSPHSGRVYPKDFRYACPLSDLRRAEDAYLDQLLDFLPALGIPFLQAQFPRAYVDPNRPDTISPLAADGIPARAVYLPADNGILRGRCTPRCGTKVYDRPPSLRQAFARVAHYYRPYHAALAQMLEDGRRRHGQIVHLNCHSMPSTLKNGIQLNPHDMIIGTRDDTSAAAGLAEALQAILSDMGYKVAINVPGYKGAEILRRHADPAAGIHGLQLEINRGLYLDEEKTELRDGFATLKKNLRLAIAQFDKVCAAALKPAAAKPAPTSLLPDRTSGARTIAPPP